MDHDGDAHAMQTTEVAYLVPCATVIEADAGRCRFDLTLFALPVYHPYMDSLHIAATLRMEAEQLLRERGIDDILRDYGTVFHTGSYHLDLMAWRDIDITMVLEPDPHSLDQFFAMGTRLVHVEGVFRANFMDTRRRPKKDLPAGFYWGIKLDTGGALPWKMDIWAADADHLRRNKCLMERVASALTEETRRLILDTKQALITPEGRTPMMSGVPIYEAILFKGLRSLDDIRAYLREQNIEA